MTKNILDDADDNEEAKDAKNAKIEKSIINAPIKSTSKMVLGDRASQALHKSGVILLLSYPLNFMVSQYELLHQPGLQTQNPKTPVLVSKKLFKIATYSRKNMFKAQYLFVPL